MAVVATLDDERCFYNGALVVPPAKKDHEAGETTSAPMSFTLKTVADH
jgi:hypothetical protein